MSSKIFTQSNQSVWAEYFTEEYVPKIRWNRMNSGGHRFYYSKINESVKTAMGITSALQEVFGEGKFIRQWKDDTPNWKVELEKRANYGTLLHAAFLELAKGEEVNKSWYVIAEEQFSKGVQFKKDVLSIKKFMVDNNVTFYFLEGILAKRYVTVNGQEFYLCSAIDCYCEMDYTEKTKQTIEDGVYVRGDKKGQVKYKEETTTTTSRVKAIIDLKSNYEAKENKDFFQSHKYQLIFGRDLIASEFGVPKSDIKMFNLSTLGYKTEPKYELKEHFVKANYYGYTEEDLLNARIELGMKEGIFTPKGNIYEISDEISIHTKDDMKVYNYEEFASKLMDS